MSNTATKHWLLACTKIF